MPLTPGRPSGMVVVMRTDIDVAGDWHDSLEPVHPAPTPDGVLREQERALRRAIPDVYRGLPPAPRRRARARCSGHAHEGSAPRGGRRSSRYSSSVPGSRDRPSNSLTITADSILS